VTPDVRDRLRHSIAGHEGLVLKAYDDDDGKVVNPGKTVRGWVTIGYGRNLIGRGITQAEADYLLTNDMDAVERELDQRMAYWRQWSPARQFAIAEITFNMGVAPFVAGWPNTVAHLKAGLFSSAAARLSASKWRKQVGDGRAVPLIRMIQFGEFL